MLHAGCRGARGYLHLRSSPRSNRLAAALASARCHRTNHQQQEAGEGGGFGHGVPAFSVAVHQQETGKSKQAHERANKIIGPVTASRGPRRRDRQTEFCYLTICNRLAGGSRGQRSMQESPAREMIISPARQRRSGNGGSHRRGEGSLDSAYRLLPVSSESASLAES